MRITSTSTCRSASATPISSHNKEKRIFRLPDDELGGLRKLGGASVPSIGMAIHMAFNRVPDFYDRVVGYRLCNDRIAEMAQEVLKEPYFTIEFFELDVPLPPPRRADAQAQSFQRRPQRPEPRGRRLHLHYLIRRIQDHWRHTRGGLGWLSSARNGHGGGSRRLPFGRALSGIPEFSERVAGYRFDGNKLRSFTAEEPLIRYVSVTFYELLPE